MGIAVDVADRACIEAMIGATLQVQGRVDIPVNDAGVGGNTPFLETGLAE